MSARIAGKAAVLICALTVLGFSALTRDARSESEDTSLRYDAKGHLLRPAEYREWPCIGTGFNMVYGPLRNEIGSQPMFTNVFVNPASYRAFLKSGTWPDRTLFILEIRSAAPVNNSSTGNNGRYQGELVGIEAEVKDTRRFADGWAFFNLSADEPSGEQIPPTASCYSCHAVNGAVDNTFVQFYPTLRDSAKQHGTLKSVAEVF